MEVKFISNSIVPQAHDKQIVELIKSSDEVWMAVAFLKERGLNLIREAMQEKLNEGRDIHIVVGLYFGITDPAALTDLLKMNGIGKLNLYMAKDGVNERNFHPKLYIFRSGKNYTIISGSANITNGGLTKNIECSLQVTAHEDESVCKDALKFIDDLINNNCDLATEPLIAQYEKDWLKQKDNPKNSKWNKGFDDEEVTGENDELGKKRKYCKLTLGDENNNNAEDCLNRGYIGIGYRVYKDLSEDLLTGEMTFKDNLRVLINNGYKIEENGIEVLPDKGVVTQRCNWFWKLFHNTQIGDIFICPADDNSFLVGEIVPKQDSHSDKKIDYIGSPPPSLLYYYATGEDYRHRMNIKWLGKILKSSIPKDLLGSVNRITYYELVPKYVDIVESLLKSESFIKFNN
jgi:HKD family nuclease